MQFGSRKGNVCTAFSLCPTRGGGFEIANYFSRNKCMLPREQVKNKFLDESVIPACHLCLAAKSFSSPNDSSCHQLYFWMVLCLTNDMICLFTTYLYPQGRRFYGKI